MVEQIYFQRPLPTKGLWCVVCVVCLALATLPLPTHSFACKPRSGFRSNKILQMSTIPVSPLQESATRAPFANSTLPSPLANAVSTSTSIAPTETVTGETKTTTKRRKRVLPAWSKSVNQMFGVPFITHADRMHIHAASGFIWFVGAYSLLATGLFQGATTGSLEAFTTLTPAHLLIFSSGVTMAISSFAMLPSRKQLQWYKAQMRNAMAGEAILISSICALMLPGHNDLFMIDPTLISVAHLTAGLGMAMLLYDSVFEQRPWNVVPILEELGIELHRDFRASLGIVNAVALGWANLTLLLVSHIAFADAGHLTNLGGDSEAFAALLGLSLAVAPSTDALVSGTIVKNDRFLKSDGERLLLNGDAATGIQTKPGLEMLQLGFVMPGPTLVAFALTVLQGHTDAIADFFYVDTIQQIMASFGN